MIKSNKQASELCSEAEDAAYQATCQLIMAEKWDSRAEGYKENGALCDANDYVERAIAKLEEVKAYLWRRLGRA